MMDNYHAAKLPLPLCSPSGSGTWFMDAADLPSGPSPFLRNSYIPCGAAALTAKVCMVVVLQYSSLDQV